MAAAAIWRIGQPQNKIVVTFDSSKIQQKDEYPKDHLVTSFLSMIDNDKIPFTLSLSLSLSLLHLILKCPKVDSNKIIFFLVWVKKSEIFFTINYNRRLLKKLVKEAFLGVPIISFEDENRETG